METMGYIVGNIEKNEEQEKQEKTISRTKYQESSQFVPLRGSKIVDKLSILQSQGPWHFYDEVGRYFFVGAPKISNTCLFLIR